MSTEFESNTDNTEDTFSSQDDDKRFLFKWTTAIAVVIVVACFVTTSLLKVLGVISVSWLWVVAAAMISSSPCLESSTCRGVNRVTYVERA